MKAKSIRIRDVALITAIIVCAFSVTFTFLSYGDSSTGNPIVPAGQTPLAGDYTAEYMTQTAGFITAVTITAKDGKSPGEVSNIRYAGNTAIPQTEGSYHVTFDVTAAAGWSAAAGLSAGHLVVTNSDYINTAPES